MALIGWLGCKTSKQQEHLYIYIANCVVILIIEAQQKCSAISFKPKAVGLAPVQNHLKKSLHCSTNCWHAVTHLFFESQAYLSIPLWKIFFENVIKHCFYAWLCTAFVFHQVYVVHQMFWISTCSDTTSVNGMIKALLIL